MLIPIRCFTCNKVIADKWNAYNDLIKSSSAGPSEVILNKSYISSPPKGLSAEAQALETLKITRICCRRHFLTTSDIIERL